MGAGNYGRIESFYTCMGATDDEYSTYLSRQENYWQTKTFTSPQNCHKLFQETDLSKY